MTGTIAIQVEDFNDHCPELVTKSQTMCLGDRVIYATGVDGDAFPNAAPFEFTVIGGSTTERWTVEHLNGKQPYRQTYYSVSVKWKSVLKKLVLTQNNWALPISLATFLLFMPSKCLL